MLSIEMIRKDPEYVYQALRRRGEDIPIPRLVEMDGRRRQAIQKGDELRARRNDESKRIARMREKPQDLIEELRRVGEEIKLLEQESTGLEAEIRDFLLELPNIPLDDVPEGTAEEDNVVIRTWREPRSLEFTPRPHWELGEELGIIDFQRGVKLSGSRFFILTGMGAKLERALISWMLDLHVSEHGYKEIYTPAVVKREVMEGSGNLPKFGNNLYHDEEDDLWLVPTAEVPLTGIHRDEILPPGTLPLYYTAYTPCFRREKAAAGRDTRGIKRVHQFDKVEMYKFVEPEKSAGELEESVGRCRGRLPAIGPALPGAEAVRRGDRVRLGQVLRPGDVGPGLRRVAGGKLLLQLHRFPGPQGGHTVSPRAGSAPRIPSHPQRLRSGPAQGSHIHPGELPAGRRLGGHARGAEAIHRVRCDPGPMR